MPPKFNFLLGLFMSVAIQSLVALVTATTEAGFSDINVVKTLWQNTFITALHAGLVLALVMAATIRPRLLATLGLTRHLTFE